MIAPPRKCKATIVRTRGPRTPVEMVINGAWRTVGIRAVFYEIRCSCGFVIEANTLRDARGGRMIHLMHETKARAKTSLYVLGQMCNINARELANHTTGFPARFPLGDSHSVRVAIERFNAHLFRTIGERRCAFFNILRAAKQHGVDASTFAEQWRDGVRTLDLSIAPRQLLDDVLVHLDGRLETLTGRSRRHKASHAWLVQWIQLVIAEIAHRSDASAKIHRDLRHRK